MNYTDHQIECFVESLSWGALLAWADTYNVEHDEGAWFDDEWPDKEDELRVTVVAAMQA